MNIPLKEAQTKPGAPAFRRIVERPFAIRGFLLRLAMAVAIVLLFALLSRAGGPKYIAGVSYFQAPTAGQPLVWPQGLITFYTDQGDLSPALPNAAANSFVADAFSQWTSVPTAAIAAASGGQLAEDVNGTNVTVNSDGTISIPTDIQSSATTTPVGIVYDEDGSVTDALLGSGAGGAGECFSNAVFGGNDNYGALATFQHALIVINGQCAQQPSQLVDVEYRLVRVIGAVFGLDWSQLNPNVITGTPPPTTDDFAGFPVMHDLDPASCVPITRCYANPYQLTMDDMAALSRLYPVSAQNLSNFPGKQVFSSATARIHGSVWFTDTSGNPTQAMQGVNVVARWVDPATGLPSRRYAASSISGFLFTGNAGNPITGFTESTGNPFSDWGSGNQALEGFFDLAGLQSPDGGSAQYQLTVEVLDPVWSAMAGPYAPYLVTPSGSGTPVMVTVAPGQDATQDVLLQGSAEPVPQWSPSETWTAPAPVLPAGDWMGSLSDYGDVAYFLLPAQANRTLSVAVTAVDESGKASESKAQPVIAMWSAGDPQGTAPPAFTTSPFNAVPYGLTRLDTQVATSSNFLIGIADLRGDGRPDYHYHAHVLYADSVLPARMGVNGGPITLQGTGFAPGLTVSVGGAAATMLATGAGQMILAAPAVGDGPQNLTITDPVSGASSTITNALTFGAAAGDNIILVSGLNQPTPVGAKAAHPVSVRVLSSDGITPVNGASIGWSATNQTQLSACGGGSSCTVATDQSGGAITWMTPAAAGTSTITATLAPLAYSAAKAVSATLSATETASDIGVMTPFLWIASGATVTVPLTARALSNGAPRSNVKVSFTLVSGSAALSATSATTNSTGYATVNVTLSQFAALVQVSACVGTSPCQPFYLNPVPLAQQNMQLVAGAGQIIAGQPFQPVVVRITDSSSPPNPVMAASVAFQTTVARGTDYSGTEGGTQPTNPVMPEILQVTQSVGMTDVNGLAALVPSSGGFIGPLEVDLTVMAGNRGFLDYPLLDLATIPGGSNASRAVLPPHLDSPRERWLAELTTHDCPP
jgi:hypothetical protein